MGLFIVQRFDLFPFGNEKGYKIRVPRVYLHNVSILWLKFETRIVFGSAGQGSE
jgi:hypothetical protein